ncbi:ABC transporter permease [Aeromonas hydrophila]|uniref:ABC transporter permease n=1 Tax=Aeromonas hydrophila TaxID=644 RepID=UPI000332A8D9|nr:ABC transporter permease [Aeromonas hydrophila]AGM45484.1 multidrug ABC transporter permease [Aeromonas hydrophila ML09-119]AHX34103.1 multidrug ABC transporter permease [Aeromonas hydrophila subsp. hydrophila AL09-71]AHX70904.1 multidrug ABC transporter permease [Aeromonas hydrophila pc104A]AJE35116.1 multidrug ABC transporter permease [Aeromonas hydrophila J-1]AKJ33312.1 multidrug ABC transporter permease [Aeromonas hydrophila NJ-35]
MGREWRLLWQDPFGRALASWVPLLLMGILCWVFSAGLARDLKIGLVDLDQSLLSRELAFSLDASAGLKVAQQFDSIEAGASALRGGDIYALVVLPNHLERDARQGTQPQVTVFNNGQFILIAKLVNSVLAQVVGTLNGQVGVLSAMAGGKALPGALGQAVPIASQVTALYNINSSYAQFLLSALLPAVWQILVVLYGINALARTDRLGLDWTTKGVWFGLWRTLLPHVLIGWGWGLGWSLLLFKGFGYPMQGSWLVLTMGLGLASAACVSMGAFFYGIIRDPARALSLAGAYTAPGFAFMGVTFPVSAMGDFAQFWRSLLPISHYVELQIGQTNYGQPLAAALPQFGALLLFLLPLLLVVRRYQAQASSAPVNEEPRS